MRPLTFVLVAGVTSSTIAATAVAAKDHRDSVIARAQVWEATDIPSMNLKIGPTGEKAFKFLETVTCKYDSKKLPGATPKFACRIEQDDEVKVKYGGSNGEVYAEVAATRLLWAMGFGADRYYPVKIVCRGCSTDIPGVIRSPQESLIDPAIIERKMPGKPWEPNDIWAWDELDRVDERAGGAPRAQRDALKLMAVFLQHSDNKPEQQRIVCLDGKRTDCASPVLYLHDVGLTFGEANRFNRRSIGGVNLQKWSAAGIWKDRERCIGNLKKSATGTLTNPRISEAGRAFLASLLVQLTDQQLRDLFDVGRVVLREPNTSIDDWVQTFKRKRDDIVNHRCRS